MEGGKEVKAPALSPQKARGQERGTRGERLGQFPSEINAWAPAIHFRAKLSLWRGLQSLPFLFWS